MTNRNGTTAGLWSRLWGRRADDELAPYRRLAVQLHNEVAETGDHRSLLVVTPTRSAINAHSCTYLACSAAAELRIPILIIDGCSRHPATSRLMRCEDHPGFAEILAGSQSSWEELILPTVHENVSFLPAGDHACASAGPPIAVDQFLSDVQKKYGMIVIAGGSVLDDAAVPLLAPHVGCVLLSVIENETYASDLEAAQDTLAHCRARRVGLLLTQPLRRKAKPLTQIRNHHRSHGAT